MALTGGLLGLDKHPSLGLNDIGGLDVLNPAISGHFFAYWTRIPEFIDKQALREATRMLMRSITIPGINLNTTEGIYGQGGAGKVNAPVSTDYSREITIGWNEQMGQLPIMHLHEDWVNIIRDPLTGLSKIENPTVRNISGDLLVGIMKPTLTGSEILEKAFALVDVYPKSVPYDVLNPSKESNDKISYDIPYQIREMVVNDKILDYAKVIAQEKIIPRFRTMDKVGYAK